MMLGGKTKKKTDEHEEHESEPKAEAPAPTVDIEAIKKQAQDEERENCARFVERLQHWDVAARMRQRPWAFTPET